MPLSSCDQQDGAAEGGEEQHAEECCIAIEAVDAVQRDRDEEAQPEDDVQDHCRTDTLGGEAKGSGRSRDTCIGQQAIAERATGGSAARDHMADRQ